MIVRTKPCSECPWSRETPPGQFPADRYEELRATTGEPGNEAPMDAGMFGCHKSSEADTMPCAGWLAAVGVFSLNVRLHLMRGAIPPEAMKPGEGWPALFDSYEEMAAVQSGPKGAVSFCPNERCASFGHWQTVTPGYPCPVCKAAETTDGGRR